MKRYPSALTIAGSDSGGCAGIQADLKTFSALGVFGASVITALTAQNTTQVRAVEVVSARMVEQQLCAVLDDIRIDAVKTGMLPSAETIEVVAGVIGRYGLRSVVVDPVMVATSGARLASTGISESFLAHSDKFSLITPNIPEAEALSGCAIGSVGDMAAAARVLMGRGCRAVLIKGGHLSGAQACDILFQPEREPIEYVSAHIDTDNLHGTGCTLSSAIAANLALGKVLEDAITEAKRYITDAIVAGSDVATGKGCGPVNHFFDPRSLKAEEL